MPFQLSLCQPDSLWVLDILKLKVFLQLFYPINQIFQRPKKFQNLQFMSFTHLCHYSQKNFFSFIFWSFNFFDPKLLSILFLLILRLYIPSQTTQHISYLIPHLILEILHHLLYPLGVHPSWRHLLLFSTTSASTW